ncbi:hypothetical protein BJ742DRAFT_794773 [Cladochytrium replicatum]|nr:hypothetical protein BJ742DRAFT_794773 [Cladochytrium replicatum]
MWVTHAAHRFALTRSTICFGVRIPAVFRASLTTATQSAINDSKPNYILHPVKIQVNPKQPTRLSLLLPLIVLSDQPPASIPTSKSLENEPVHGECLFPCTVDTSLWEFSDSLREEFPLTRLEKVTDRDGREVEDPWPLTFPELGRRGCTVWLSAVGQGEGTLVGLTADMDLLNRAKMEAQASLKRVEEELKEMGSRKALLDVSVEVRVNLAHYGILAYLTTQLATVVYLTYELGWDLIEPVAYFLGYLDLFSAGAYFLVRQEELTLSGAENYGRTFFERQIYSWHKFDTELYQALRQRYLVEQKRVDTLNLLLPQPE